MQFTGKGLNKVLVTINGPQEPSRRSDQINNQESGFITVNVLNTPFSGNDRKKKRSGDRRTTEIESIVKETFNSIVILDIYPRSEILICIQVFETDGSLICAILNATTMALIDAGINLKDMVLSCSVGVHKQNQIYLDVTQTEQTWSNCSAYLPIAIKSKSDEIVYMQLDSRISVELLEEALKLVVVGCKKMKTVMEDALKSHMIKSFNKLEH